VNDHSSAAGCTVGRGSVAQTSCSATFAHTPETRDLSVSTAADDLLAPIICRNTLALTWRPPANVATLNCPTPPPSTAPALTARISY